MLLQQPSESTEGYMSSPCVLFFLRSAWMTRQRKLIIHHFLVQEVIKIRSDIGNILHEITWECKFSANRQEDGFIGPSTLWEFLQLIGPLSCRLYAVTMNKHFSHWNTPSPVCQHVIELLLFHISLTFLVQYQSKNVYLWCVHK